MKKKLIIFLVLMYCSVGFTQKTQQRIKGARSYISLKSYKELYGDNFAKKDSLNFMIRENDTLVLLSKGNNSYNIGVPYELKDSVFLEVYKDLVYNKYAIVDSVKKRKLYMRLWNKPIKVFFSKSVDKKYKKIISTLARGITKEIDSLDITIVEDLEKSNYIVYQIDENNSYKYSKNIRKNEYIKYYSFWNKNRIYDTKLEINVTKYKNNRINANYVMQNFLTSLGHFYKSSKLQCRSIFSNCDNSRKQFTKEDLEFLKYHYSYGICKFTDLEKFEEAHKGAKEMFSKTGSYPIFIN